MGRSRQPSCSEAGQTTIEFAISVGILVLSISGAGWLFYAKWQRAKCAYLVFEHTHARLTGVVSFPTLSALSKGIHLQEDELGVEGQGRCQDAMEKVRLRKLEGIQW